MDRTPQIELYLHVERDWLDRQMICRWERVLQELLPELKAVPPGPDHVLTQLESVEISIVGDDDIARVHGEFLDDPHATDVITFPYGEILVSCDTASRYAAEHGLDREEELFRYIIHGLVHLQGYLDHTPEARDDLFAVQEPLVARYFPK